MNNHLKVIPKIDVSVILPAYNEAKRIRDTVAATANTLKEITASFEIIIAEDGSTDGTAEIAAELSRTHEYVKHLHSDARQGRGRALNRAFKFASGDILCYIDVDLATDMKHLRELIDSIRYDRYDFSTGSRMMPESDVKRPFKRGFASKGFNLFTRTLLHSKLYDHQCGFKAFKRKSLFMLLDSIEDEHWFWDTELLVRAQHAGYVVKEFPVVWRHGGATKVDLIKDVIGMGSQILRLWWQLNMLPLIADSVNQFRKFLFVGIANTLIDVFIFNLLMFASGIYNGYYLLIFNTISYSLGTINSYILNKKWTFKDKSKCYSNQFAVFITVSLIGMGLNNAIIYGLTTYMSPAFGLEWLMWVNFAKIIGIGVVLMWNFIGYKILVFNDRSI
jgi:hypothetical protein